MSEQSNNPAPVRDAAYMERAKKAKEVMNLIKVAFVNMHLVNASRIMHKVDLTPENWLDIKKNSADRVQSVFDRLLDNDAHSNTSDIMTKVFTALCEDFLSAAKEGK